MLKSHKYTKMEKCLVVCPLNTVLNWVNEFEIWLTDVDFEIEVRLELCYDKTCIWVIRLQYNGLYYTDQVRHKPGCTATDV